METHLNIHDYDETLLNEDQVRFSVFPIQHQDIYDEYKKQLANFWVPDEIDFSRDYDDFQTLNPDEQYFIKMVLAFFSNSDNIVNMNLGERFTREVKVLEALMCYRFQQMMEDIHSITYSLQIDNIIRDIEEKTKLFNSMDNFPCVSKKMGWAMRWIHDRDASFAQRLIAFAIVEGLFFSGSFCSIFWLKKRNIMPGLCSSNEFISRDEGMHCKFAILLYSKIKNKLPQSVIHDMFMDAVGVEKEFICESLPCSLLGMNSKLMGEYIEYVADQLLDNLGYEKIYETPNPFDFMESLKIEGKSNFFETRPTQYQKSSVLNKTKETAWEVIEEF